MKARKILRNLILLLLLVATAAGLSYRYLLYRKNLQAAKTPLSHNLKLTSGDRVLVVAPHCDDESLGCGGVLARASDMHLPVKVIIVTNGDGFRYAAVLDVRKLKVKPADYIRFAAKRQEESLEALAGLGVPPDRVTFLGYPDRGTDEMWLSNWSTHGKPYFSPFTRSDHSPYANSLTPGVAYCGENELKDLERIAREFHPTVLFAPHPNDAHPDHWATHAFVTAALERIRAEWSDRHDPDSPSFRRASAPRMLTYLVHRGVYPAPKGLRELYPMAPPYDLLDCDTLWLKFELTEGEIKRKERAVLQYKSQLPLLRKYMLSFVRKNELFGIYPARTPEIARRNLRIDGDFEDWAGIPVTLPDPKADTVSLKALGAADITDITLARNKRFLFLRMQVRDPVAYSVDYRIHLHTFTREDEDYIPFKLDIGFRRPQRIKLVVHSPTDTTFSTRVLRARCKSQSIELSIPFYLLGNADGFMISGMTKLEGINVDKTAFLIVPPS
ncbi:MAG: PIG-L family deacetylase [Armatimonadetes bacterium]|nr:PIG-L family deacetylase [Armatimonadota bacterium]